MATWWVRWVVISIQQKHRIEKSRDSGWRRGFSSQGWTQATFIIKLPSFALISSQILWTNIAVVCFFFPCGKVGIPIGIHSWWNFHETFDHLGTDSPGKHPGAFKTIIAWQFCWWPFEGMVRFSDLQWLACDENLSGFSRCCIGLFIYLGSGPPP